ncbi:hypothetical protein EDD21DRAFT_364284 [Dissophora ornata]|nr:hypothetical protein EDD21DRAFT_364284 [Dissophora ornata]
MAMESFTSPVLISTKSFSPATFHTLSSPQQPRSPFMLPELDQLIASHLDKVTLANASRVCRLWYSIFNPVLWKYLSLQHVSSDDDYDEDFNFISRATPPSSLYSLPSSCSSTWSAMSMNSPTSPASPVNTSSSYYLGLTLLQQAFVYSSRNRVLKGLVRQGQWVHELKATGITDQEMALIGVLCPNLRVLELIGGRYTSENLGDLFQKRRDSIQVVRFRSCVLLKDIFQPLRQLVNLREFELYGSFVGNTITSPYFFERDFFPMLQSCPQLRSILIEQVYIVDQQVNQGRQQAPAGEWNGGGGVQNSAIGISSPSPPRPTPITTISMPATSPSSLSLASSSSASILSAQLRSTFISQSVRNPYIYSTATSSLKSLNLDCGDIPDSVIAALLTRCPLLEQLSLDWSRNLTDTTLLSLQRLCPNLTNISLSRCAEISENGFKALFKIFPGLISLDLSNNTISDSVLEELAASCRLLKHLNINYCVDVTDLGVQAVLLNCANLSSFSLRFVPGLSCLLFDDTITTLLPSTGASGSGLSSSPPTSSTFRLLPYHHRRWACRESLESLHLPDLVQPNSIVLKKWQHHQSLLHPNSNASHAVMADKLLQSRLQYIQNLKHLTIGGNSLDLRVIMDGLEHPRELETLRITKLKRTMTCDDAQWLVEQAAPRLKRLAVPVFGNSRVIEWIDGRRPGLLSFEK